MILALTLPQIKKPNYFFVVLLLTGLGGGVYCFSISYLYHSNVIIGALLFPFAIFVDGSRRNNYAYLLLIFSLIAVACIYNIRIAYFFALAIFALWLTEYFVGRCNSLILFLIAFMSPFFSQITTILGFALRLELSNISGAVLRTAGLDVAVEGNMIVLDGSTFSVDEACMGLNMLAMSMLMGVFLLSYRYLLTGKRLGLPWLLFFFVLAFGFNLLTNLLRIIVLVFFEIPPGNHMHEVIGVSCFFLYTVLPLYFVSGWLIDRVRVVNIHNEKSKAVVPKYKRALLIVFALCMLGTGIRVADEKQRLTTSQVTVQSPYGNNEILHDGVVKIISADLLIYVKPIPEFFSGEHTPLICWKGSGYSFHGIRELDLAGKKIYIGKLTKDEDVLYTSWWYSNGVVETNSQLEWRLRMLKGERKFCLVNVTAKEEKVLLANLTSMLKDNTLTIE